MSQQHSSLARVQPIFNQLLDQWPGGETWLGELWEMAARRRPGVALARPEELGSLVASDTPLDHAARLGQVYERTLAPPAAFLSWLLENPGALQVRDPTAFGAKSDDAKAWRAKLFSGDQHLVGEAQREGLNQLGKRLAQRGRNKWWAFEGFSRIDCCLITDACVLFVEGNCTEGAASSTLWFPRRTQLWRNVEAAGEFAGGKPFAVMLGVEHEANGAAALADAERSLAGSYPHLDARQRAELSRHLIGFVTWGDVVTRFGLRPESLLDSAPKC